MVRMYVGYIGILDLANKQTNLNLNAIQSSGFCVYHIA